jgi:1-aminocyclopropane-1-carboxylate deaminase/D-cysteine desulfhydrase-like pyridoxal-dependent ACC family enzyme
MTAVLPGQAGMPVALPPRIPLAVLPTAAAQAVRTEGLMTDPVYTAKALSLLARHPAAGPVVFWHTGGMLDVVAAAQDVAR